MSSLPARRTRDVEYPTRDGKPMAETDLHRDLMVDLIATLRAFFAQQSRVYVSGNLLLFFEEGDRRRHVSPDVFVAFGVDKRPRDHYLLWQERPPRLVIELTSKTTRDEDVAGKFALYRDVLKVREYFLFDPREEYLRPSLQGWRLRGGVYGAIRAVGGRLPSQALGLHLERQGQALRLWNPASQTWLPTPLEAIEAEARGRQEAERRLAEALAELQRMRQLREGDRPDSAS